MRRNNEEYDGMGMNIGCLAVVIICVAIDVAAFFALTAFARWVACMLAGASFAVIGA